MKSEKPTYEELKKRVEELEKAASERIDYEAALRNTQKRFIALYEQAPVGIAVIDSRTGQFLDVNDAYCRIVGYPKPDMLVMDFMRITHPDDLREDLDNMARLRAGEISRFQMEKRYFRKDGSIVWVSLTVVPLWEERADPLHHIAIVEDITERKRSGEALKISERTFRNIAENMPGMVLKYKLNPDGSDELLYISKGVEDIFEVTKEAVVNNNKLLWDRIHGDDLKGYVESIKASAKNLSPWEREHRIRLPDGRVKWTNSRGVPAQQEDGSVVWDTLAVDITDRKKAEEALREAHAFLQRIIDNSLSLIVAKNRKGEYILANDISAQLLGLQKDDMTGKTDYDLFPKETAERLAADDGKVFETGAPLHAEEQFQIRHRNYTFTTTKFPLFDADGELYAICAMATDITKRIELERALKASEERFRAIFEQASAGIATATAEGRFLETNGALRGMLGYTDEELLEMTVYDITFPEDRERQMEKDRPVLEGNENTVSLEKRFVHKDGHPVWAKLSSQVIRDEDGKIQYVIGVLVDINEQKRAEAELQKSNALLEATGRMARVGGWELDTATSMVSWTEETCRIHEVPMDQKPPLEEALVFYPPEAKEPLTQAIQRAMDHGEPYDLEIPFVTAKGRSLWVRTICRPEVVDGKTVKLSGTFQDITVRKNAEMALKNALAEKETLLREIHHRVKNNMQTIVGLLRMHARKADDGQLTQIFSDCRDRITAMSLIHESLYQSDDLARIDFGAYLKKLCRNLGRAYDTEGKGVALEINVDNVSLNMDQGIAVGMVVTELIANAFKHAFPGDKGGNVSVTLSSLDAESVELMVADDGKGIPPEVDPFDSGSIGLRLATAAVIRELGGTMDVERDNGARFIIRFKCEPPRFPKPRRSGAGIKPAIKPRAVSKTP